SQFMEVLKEALPMIQLRHPNIVQLLGICRDDKHGLMIVIELCEGGSLASYLAKNRPLPPDVRDRFAKQICEGVQYLHDNQVVHRDLKPENILLDEGHNIKISDFGMIRSSDRKTTLTAVGGTPNFMPPEGFDVDLDKLSAKADIWALGGILGQIHGGRPPFEGQGILQISRKVVDKKEIPDIPASLPPHIKNAIKSCFAYKASDRPTAKHVLDELGISPPPTPSPPHLESEKERVVTKPEAASHPPANVSLVGHTSGVHMSMASTTTGPPSTVSPAQIKLAVAEEQTAFPTQQPSVKTPPSAPQPQIKHTDIFDAVNAGDEAVEAVRLLINKEGKDILDKRDDYEITPFLLAAQKCQYGSNALHRAAGSGHVAAVNKLLEWDPKLIDAHTWADVLEVLYAKRNDLLTQTRELGTTPFIRAAWEGHVGVMEAMLEWGGGALLDIKGPYGQTPWDMAAVNTWNREKKAEIREIMEKYRETMRPYKPACGPCCVIM
ncbi:unnamed protein product, partial [Vitrella brassicaformis CCMP3155]